MIPSPRRRAYLIMPGRPAHAAMLATILLLAVAGCGGGAEKRTTTKPTASSPAPPAPSEGTSVTIQDFKYAPPSISTTVGARLTFSNADNAEHTATADVRSAFDTGAITHGRAKAITVAKAGTFAYHCDFHPFMHGTVVVRGGPRPKTQPKPAARSTKRASPKASAPRAPDKPRTARSGRSSGVEGGGSGGY